MKVSDRMVHSIVVCTPETPLREAVHLMWNYNYGILPVIGADKKVKAVLTERDLSTVGNLRGLSAGQIASMDVATCGPDDDIYTAIETLDRSQVPGLPVLDEQGYVRGILYRHDILVQPDLKPKDADPRAFSDMACSSRK
jgi:CBS domain-containing protein